MARHCCIAPFLFRRNPGSYEMEQEMEARFVPKRQANSLRGGHSRLQEKTVELRKKISTFRDVIDLSPFDASASTTELLIGTMEDLGKLYPDIITKARISEMKGGYTEEGLACFSNLLKFLGSSWMINDDLRMAKLNCCMPATMKNASMEQHVEALMAILDCVIEVASSNYDAADEDEQDKESNPDSNRSSCYPSPLTPTSVLNCNMGFEEFSKVPYKPCQLLPLRLQAVGKLNPIDLKRLSIHMLPHVVANNSANKVQKIKPAEEAQPETVVKSASESIQESVKDLKARNDSDPSANHKSLTVDQSQMDVEMKSNSESSSPQDCKCLEEPLTQSEGWNDSESKKLETKAAEELQTETAAKSTSESIQDRVKDVKARNDSDSSANHKSLTVEESQMDVEMKSDSESSTPRDCKCLEEPSIQIEGQNASESKKPETAAESTSDSIQDSVKDVKARNDSDSSANHKSLTVEESQMGVKMERDSESSTLQDCKCLEEPTIQIQGWNDSESKNPKKAANEADVEIEIDSKIESSNKLHCIITQGTTKTLVTYLNYERDPQAGNGIETLMKTTTPPEATTMDISPHTVQPNGSVASSLQLPQPDLSLNVLASRSVSQPPSPPPQPPSPPSPPPNFPSNGTMSKPTPPAPTATRNVGAPPPPPPLPPASCVNGNMKAPLLPPPPIPAKGLIPSVPPPMPPQNGAGAGAGAAAPPPPPPGGRSLRPKKTATKLKRSTHMGNLYRLLRGKIEGSCLTDKSFNGRKAGNGSGGGGQSMADALAEMTKRSAYFQQIEEDVLKYANTIIKLKAAITTFQTKDMPEMLKFHKHVESHLEHLTDESQVLSRFEGFPAKKLEALRMAAALYLKLEGMHDTLVEWKIEPPLNQLIDKVEKYFNKLKGEVDALERTKDEETKRFQSQNIHFDFSILVKIKESMVDLSSGCMELALKDSRESKEAGKTGCGKMLWRAFQLAFKVYTFAGGQDDRADKLTREVASEIETDH